MNEKNEARRRDTFRLPESSLPCVPCMGTLPRPRGGVFFILTLERGDDAEEVEDNKLEGARRKGEKDQGPGQAEDQAEAQQCQHVGPLLGVWTQPQDLHHHCDQHGRVEQKHQAEEAQVGDVADQGVLDPAPMDQDMKPQSVVGLAQCFLGHHTSHNEPEVTGELLQEPLAHR